MGTPIGRQDERSVLLGVSNAMVRIYKEQFGRGPTRARSDWAGPDALLCTLEDTLTPAERKLVEYGEETRLIETRLFFQHACKEDFRATVEEITGRTVRGFVSGTDPTTDISSEVFYFITENGSDERISNRVNP